MKTISKLFLSLISLSCLSAFAAQHTSDAQFQAETDQKLARARAAQQQELQAIAASDAGMNTSNDNGMNTRGDRSASSSSSSAQRDRDGKQERARAHKRSPQKDLEDGHAIMVSCTGASYQGQGLPPALQNIVFDYAKEMNYLHLIGSRETENWLEKVFTDKNGHSFIISSSKNIDIWDAETGHLVRTLKTLNNEADLQDLIIHTDAKNNWFVIALFEDDQIYIWDGRTGELIYNYSLEIDPNNYIKLTSYADSSNNWYFIACSFVRNGKTLFLMNAKTGKKIYSIDHQKCIKSINVHQNDDGSWCIITGSTNGIFVWHGPSGLALKTLPGCILSKKALRIISNNSATEKDWFIIGTISRDNDNIPNEISIWSGKTFALLKVLGAEDLADNNILLISSIEPYYDQQSLLLAVSEDFSENNSRVAIFAPFSKSSHLIEMIDNIRRNPWNREFFICDPQKKYLIICYAPADQPSSTILIYDATNGKLIDSIEKEGRCRNLAIFFKDNNELRIVWEYDSNVGEYDPKIHVWGYAISSFEKELRAIAARKKLDADDIGIVSDYDSFRRDALGETELSPAARGSNGGSSSSSSSSQQPQARAQLQAPAQPPLLQRTDASSRSSSASAAPAQPHGTKRKFDDDNVDPADATRAKRAKTSGPNSGSQSSSSMN